jgi:hypothetical protein
MLTFPLIHPPRRRGRAKAPARTPAPPAPLAVIGVNSVSVLGPEIEMNVVFNSTPQDPLNDPSAADATKWTARYQGQKYVGSLIGAVDFEALYRNCRPSARKRGRTCSITRTRRAIFPIRSAGSWRRSAGFRCRRGRITGTPAA